MTAYGHNGQFSACSWAFACVNLLFALVLTPGIGAAQASIYSEKFENGNANAATGALGNSVAAASYTGMTPAGQSHTASSDWLNGNQRNGIARSAGNSISPAWAARPTARRPDLEVQFPVAYGDNPAIIDGTHISGTELAYTHAGRKSEKVRRETVLGKKHETCQRVGDLSAARVRILGADGLASSRE